MRPSSLHQKCASVVFVKSFLFCISGSYIRNGTSKNGNTMQFLIRSFSSPFEFLVEILNWEPFRVFRCFF